MRCTASRVYHGPSIYSRAPVIRYTFEVASAPDLQATAERLFGLLPGLGSHYPPCEASRTPIPHLFEHVCIELQNLTGVQLHCVRASSARIAADDAIIPYEDQKVGLAAGSLGLELIETSPAEFERRLARFLRFAERWMLPAQDLAVLRAAEARDIPILPIAGRIFQLGYGRHQHRISGTETTHTNIVGNDIAANKDYSRRLLRAVGLPVPRYERVSRERDAVAAAKGIGFPVVLKPNNGNLGQGVSVGLKKRRDVRAAYQRARQFDRSVLVEEYVAGVDYRLLVIDGKLAAASKRIPAHVVGDGKHTIEELIGDANQDPRRADGHRGTWTKLDLDDQSDGLLAEQGYERGSVAREGETVYLRRIANTSAGGATADVTDQVHPENREIAERAAMAVGLDVAGVDVLVHDISQPMRAQGGVVTEINSRPGIRKHLWPTEGPPRDVINPIVDMLFPAGARTRIPIAVVTGSGDRAGTARMLVDLLAADGSAVGLAAHDGVFIQGRRADGGGLSSIEATRVLLLDPGVAIAVLELSPSEALQHGLGYDWADACAVVNDSRVDSPELVAALRVVVASARSHVVLSAEDRESYGLTPHPDARVWHLSADGHGPALYATALALCLGRKPGDTERGLAGLPLALVSPS